MTQQWKYFDFDANWEKFLEVWNHDTVQEVLAEQMDGWCEYDAPREDGKPMVYKRGDQLWEFSCTDYWPERIFHRCDKDRTEMYDAFNKRMRQLHPRMFMQNNKFNNEAAGEYMEECGFSHEVEDILYEKHKPKNNSLESFIMMRGKNYISHALFEASKILFYPEAEMVQDLDGHDLILIPDMKIVFDLYNFYFITRDNDTCESFRLQPDAYYEDLLEDYM
jgi:hypothetical protein